MTMNLFNFPSGVFVTIDHIYKLERAQEFMMELRLGETDQTKWNILTNACNYMLDISDALSEQILSGILERNDREELEAYVNEMPAIRIRATIRRHLKELMVKNCT